MEINTVGFIAVVGSSVLVSGIAIGIIIKSCANKLNKLFSKRLEQKYDESIKELNDKFESFEKTTKTNVDSIADKLSSDFESIKVASDNKIDEVVKTYEAKFEEELASLKNDHNRLIDAASLYEQEKIKSYKLVWKAMKSCFQLALLFGDTEYSFLTDEALEKRQKEIALDFKVSYNHFTQVLESEELYLEQDHYQEFNNIATECSRAYVIYDFYIVNKNANKKMIASAEKIKDEKLEYLKTGLEQANKPVIENLKKKINDMILSETKLK